MSERKRVAVLERIRDPQINALQLALRGSFARAYAPPPKMPLSDWADKYRVLSPEAAAMPGRWKTSNEPMAKGVMDSVTNPLVEKVTAMCAAQVLKALVGDVILETRQVEGQAKPQMVARFTINAVPALAVLERNRPKDRDDAPVSVWGSIHSSPGAEPATVGGPPEAVVPLPYDRREAARRLRKPQPKS